MGLFDQFPYTNFHELNLMWILEALKEIKTTTEQFVAINSLKYADPIQWNITSQYEKNTIVIDPQTGTAYISVQPVPTGVSLTNEDYWTVVFDLGSFVTRAAKNFTTRWEADTTLTATFNSVAGDWLVWGDTLYIANVNITAGDSYVVDGNIRRITIEEVKNEIYTIIGDLDELSTSDKTSIVNAINSLVTALNEEVQARTTGDENIINNGFENVLKVGKLSNTTGILLGAHSYPQLNDGMFFTMDGDPSWGVIQTYRAGRPTEITIQPCAIAGLCNVVNGVVTEIYGGRFTDAEYHYIWIDDIRYEVSQIISDTQLSLTDTTVNLSNVTFIITNAPTIAYYNFNNGSGEYVGGHRLANWNVNSTFDYNGVTYTITSITNDGYNCVITPALTGDNVTISIFGDDYEVAALGINRLSGRDEERLVFSVKADGQYHIGTIAVGNGKHHPILFDINNGTAATLETWGGWKFGTVDSTSYNGTEIGLREKPMSNDHMLYIQRRNPDVAGNDNLQFYHTDAGTLMELAQTAIQIYKELQLNYNGGFAIALSTPDKSYNLHNASGDIVLSRTDDGDLIGYNATLRRLFGNNVELSFDQTDSPSVLIDNFNGNLRVRVGNETIINSYAQLNQIDFELCPHLRGYATADLPTTCTAGALAYCTTISAPVYYNGSSWLRMDGTAI